MVRTRSCSVGLCFQILLLTASTSHFREHSHAVPGKKNVLTTARYGKNFAPERTNLEQREHRTHDSCFSLNIDINAILGIFHEHQSQRHQLIFFQASRDALQMRPCKEFSLLSNGSETFVIEIRSTK